jgi:hypothetical protein
MGPDDPDFKFWYNHGRRLNSRMPYEIFMLVVIVLSVTAVLKLLE